MFFINQYFFDGYIIQLSIKSQKRKWRIADSQLPELADGISARPANGLSFPQRRKSGFFPDAARHHYKALTAVVSFSGFSGSPVLFAIITVFQNINFMLDCTSWDC
jgi:hypothetical protein